MNFNVRYGLVTFLSLFLGLVETSGIIEFIFNSTLTVDMEVTACATFRCESHNELARAFLVNAKHHLFIQESIYEGEARENIDLHFKVMEPTTKKVLLLTNVSQKALNNWTSVAIPSLHFDLEILVRNKCQTEYFGDRCGRYCKIFDNFTCTDKGERICVEGWKALTAAVVSFLEIPETKNHDIFSCLHPSLQRPWCLFGANKCECRDGFAGERCEKCVVRPGCVHGDCHWGLGKSCNCRKGYKGALCDEEVCKGGCQNNGVCVDRGPPFMYACICQEGFTGKNCQLSISELQCKHRSPCHNGGECLALNIKTITCKCQPGYFGKFCESEKRDCSILKCPDHSPCHMINDRPECVKGKIEEFYTNEINIKTDSVGEVQQDDGTKQNKYSKTSKGHESTFTSIHLFLICLFVVVYCLQKRTCCKNVKKICRDELRGMIEEARENLITQNQIFLQPMPPRVTDLDYDFDTVSPPPTYSSLNLAQVDDAIEMVEMSNDIIEVIEMRTCEVESVAMTNDAVQLIGTDNDVIEMIERGDGAMELNGMGTDAVELVFMMGDSNGPEEMADSGDEIEETDASQPDEETDSNQADKEPNFQCTKL